MWVSAAFIGFAITLAAGQSVTVSPSSLSFSNQVLSTPSAVQTITLKNGLTVALKISSIATTLSDYTQTNTCPISPSTLAAGATCTISVTFKPSVLGVRSGSLKITDNASNSPQTVTLSGTGIAAVTVAPTSLAFGNQAIGLKSSASSVTVTNNQAATLTINSITSSLADYTTTTTCPLTPSTLAAGGSCAVSVFFTPATSGSRSGTLTISDNASNSPTVALTGKGVIAATTNPTSLSFASQALGTTSAAKSVTLTNNQSASLTISSVSSSLADFGVSSTCPATLAGGASCTASVTFSPKATGTRSGTLTFTDSANNSPQTVPLSGTGAAANLVSIAVTPSPASIALGTTQQFAATGTYSDGTTKTLTTSAKWTSSAASVASVNASGLATSLAQGATTITATSGSISGSSTLTVTAPVLKSIAVTPATVTVPLGTSQQFTAIGTYSNKSTQNLTSSVSWSSSSAAVATINSAGLASSMGQGSATIMATSGTITGTATLSVGPPALLSIAVSPATVSIPLGTSQQFSAIGTYTNGTQNLTNSVSWTSSSPTVASVNSSGLASSIAQGSTTITATSGTIKGSATLSVSSPALVSMAVTPAAASIPLGTTQQFTATGTYSNGSTQNLTASANWSSSSAGVASVSSSGLVSGTGQGSATITAASGTISGSATLTVAQPSLVSMAITPANPSFALGTTQALKAIGTYTDGSTLDITTSVSWSTANSAIATVNAQGLATSVAVGSTSVTATLGSISGATTLTVNPATLVSIAITPAIPTIPLGTTIQFSATGTFTDGSTQNVTDTVQWNSDTTSVATISNASGTQGLASSLETGTANIAATSGSVQGSTTLTVTSAALVSIAVTPANPTIALGTTQQFVATGTFTDGTTQNLTSTATWSSDTPSSATIDSSGLAGSVAVGRATISATSNNVTGSTMLTVTPAQLVSIAVSPSAVSIPLGTTQAFDAVGTYTDGTTQDVTQAGHWSSSNAVAATISNTPGSQGLASTLGTGTTAINIALGTVSGTATLTVNPAALVSITLSPQTPTIPLGTTQQFTASGTYTDGSTQDLTTTVQWSSSSATVAVMSLTGLATSAGTGTATITASQGTVTASTTLTVGQPAIVSLAVSPTASTIPLGTTQQFQAIATYTDGSTQNLTASATWTSDTQTVALISSGGLASGIGMGAANITATSGGVSGSSALTVGPPVLVSLTVTPSALSMPLGTTQQFAALGTYTDGSTQILTGSVAWSSSSNSANISAAGLASATAVGTATITASAGSISASATITVGPPSLVSIAITPANPSFALGTTQALKAIGTYTDGSTLDITTSVSWSTANSAIATVNAQGVAASAAVGSTSVTATLGSITDTTILMVNPATLVSIAITPAIPTIPLGTTVQFSATGTFTDGSTQNVTDTVQWSSDTTSVATISNATGTQGLASSLETGTANITATSGSVQGSTSLTVTSAALVSIAVTPVTPTIALGTTQQFVATGTFTDGSTQNLTATATWSSDTLSSATINSSGLASSVGVGTATISATSNNITGSTLLSITPAQLVSIVVSPAATNIPLGTTQAFDAVGTYTDGTTQDVTQSGHWSSSNAVAATISNTPGSQGLASTLGTGTTAINIALGTVSGTATLTVNPAALVSITLSPQAPTIPLGTTQQFTASGTYTDGSVQDLTTTAQWSSSSATVAVMSATGLATSAGTGTATITATLGTVTASTTLTVGQPAIVSLAVSPTASTIPLGTTQQFQAIATYTDGSTQDLTASASWSSSVPGVAAVNATGQANSLSAGTTTISASSGGASGGAVLTVTPAVPVSLAVTPATASIAFDAQQQFQAFLTYSDGSILNVTSLVTWTSSASAIATVTNTGLATGVGAGGATIYASTGSGMMTGSALTVAPPSLLSIAVTPSNQTLALSSTQQFTATGTFVGGSTQNLTSEVAWTSSNSNVVGISSSGLGTALQFGASTITATSGNISGRDVVTVPTASAIPSSLFDMTINKTTTPWPTDPFYGQRLLGTGTLWGNIETANGVYKWTTLNKFVADAQSHGVDLIYTFLGVPQWASSNPNDTACSSWPGSCDPPSDLNSDGTGANAYWDSFVTAIATQLGTKVKYWELWDEPNVAQYANPKTWTTAQWIRMASDARQIILGINPNAVILSPGIAIGTTWLTNFLAAGGGNYVDVIAFHGYATPPESVISLITPVRAAMAAGGVSSLPLWDTETSWGLDTVLPDPNMRAGSVARLYLLHAANGVARVYWYGWDFSNRGTLWQPTASTNCETPNNGGYICLAGIAYAQVYNWMNGAVLSGCSSSGTVWTCNLARPGGYLAQVMWDSSQTCSNGVCQTTAYTPPPQFIQYRDLNGNTFTVTGSVPLGAEPIILEN